MGHLKQNLLVLPSGLPRGHLPMSYRTLASQPLSLHDVHCVLVRLFLDLLHVVTSDYSRLLALLPVSCIHSTHHRKQANALLLLLAPSITFLSQTSVTRVHAIICGSKSVVAATDRVRHLAASHWPSASLLPVGGLGSVLFCKLGFRLLPLVDDFGESPHYQHVALVELFELLLHILLSLGVDSHFLRLFFVILDLSRKALGQLIRQACCC